MAGGAGFGEENFPLGDVAFDFFEIFKPWRRFREFDWNGVIFFVLPAAREALHVGDDALEFAFVHLGEGGHGGAGDAGADGAAEVIVGRKFSVGSCSEFKSAGAEVARFIGHGLGPRTVAATGAAMALDTHALEGSQAAEIERAIGQFFLGFFSDLLGSESNFIGVKLSQQE